jgi:hypothetical protein
MCSNSPGAPPTSSTPCTSRAERLSLSTFRKAHSLWTPRWGDEAGARSPRPQSRRRMPAQTPRICALEILVWLSSGIPKRNWNDCQTRRQYIKRTSFPPTSSSGEERPLSGRFSFLLFRPCVPPPTQIARIALRYLYLVSAGKPVLAGKAHRLQVYGHPLSIGILCRHEQIRVYLDFSPGLREQES